MKAIRATAAAAAAVWVCAAAAWGQCEPRWSGEIAVALSGPVRVPRIASWSCEEFACYPNGDDSVASSTFSAVQSAPPVSCGEREAWVEALAVYGNRTREGAALYAGGGFQIAGGVTAHRIARWDGVTWSALDGGMGGGDPPRVFALLEFDDGSGPALYAGGDFSTAGGTTVNNIARWGCDGCYADCDGSGTLDLLDFLCFQNEFAAMTGYGDCDGSGVQISLTFSAFRMPLRPAARSVLCQATEPALHRMHWRDV